MRKFYLLFALLISFSSAAWADFHQPWTSTPFPWGTSDASNVPEGVTTTTSGTIRDATVSVIKEGETSDVTVSFTYSSGACALRVLGVDLVNAEGAVAKSDYRELTVGNNPRTITYTLSSVAAGDYTLRYWVCNVDGNLLNATNGLITVTGLNSAYITSLQDLSNDKVYALRTNKSPNSYVYYSAGVENVVSTDANAYNTTYDANDNKFQFAIYNDGSSYFFYNIAAGRFVGTTTAANGAIPWTAIPTNDIKIKYSANSAFAFVLSCNNETGAININAGVNSHGVLNWNGGYNGHLDDTGNQFQFLEVGDLSAETKALIAERTPWTSAYNNITYAVNNPSDVYVNAIPTAKQKTVADAKTAFENNPSTDTYNAMVSAYESNKITLAAGEQFQIQCTATDRGYLAYSTVDGNGSETNAYIAGTGGNWKEKFPAINAEGIYSEWAFVEKDSKKYIYNVQNKKFISPNGGFIAFDETGAAYVQINAVDSSPTAHRLLFNNSSSTMLSLSPGYNGIETVRTYNQPNDDGVKFYLIKTGSSVETNAADIVEGKLYKPTLEAKLAKGRLLGTGVSKYTYTGSGDATGTIATAEALLTNANATLDDINNSISALDGIYADFSLNMPEVGKLYRFRGYASKNYMAPSAATPSADTKMDMNGNFDLPATIFMLCEGDQVNGETGYKLLNYSTGYYTKKTHNLGAMASAANSMTIKEATSGNPGCYMMQTNSSSIGTWIFDNNSKVDRNGAYAAGNCDWTMEEVDWLPIPVNTTYGIGTLYSPVNLAETNVWYTKDSRLKFYIGSIENDYLVLTKLEGNLPANTPVLFEYQPGSEIKNGCSYMNIAASAEAVTAQNDLRGTLETINKPAGNIYTLQPATAEATELTFCLYTGTTLAGGKAYLPAASAVKGIRYNTGESTGIEGVATEKASKEIFDLSGRRVQNPTSGLYIINGQKVYVK